MATALMGEGHNIDLLSDPWIRVQTVLLNRGTECKAGFTRTDFYSGLPVQTVFAQAVCASGLHGLLLQHTRRPTSKC
jgi:hypothetical protein